MAVQKFKEQQEIKLKTANYELLDDILNTIRLGVDDQKHHFAHYVNAAKAEGLTPSEIFSLAKKTLITHVSLRTIYYWSKELLPPEAFDMKQSQRRLGKRNLVASIATGIQKQITYNDPSTVEDYYIEDVENYSRDFLIKLCRWLDDTLELNCRGK